MATPTLAACPACQQPVSPGQKFCGTCGAAIPAAPAPPVAAPTAPPPTGTGAPAPSAPPVDIRERVDQDRGALKKLQLLIPGYRGYRQGEDVRAADAILRLQVADRLVLALQQVDTTRSQMARDGVLAGLTPLGGLRSEIQTLEGRIRHAEQGYTGISPALRITPESLDRLYEQDWTFVASAQGILDSIPPIQAAGVAKDPAKVTAAVDQLRTQVQTLENTFAQRLINVEGVKQ